MKNFKRAAAILGVVVLLAVCCLPMIFAFGSGDNAQGNFKAAVGTVILVPVLAYVFLMVYKLLKKEEKEVAGEVKNIIFDVGQVLVSYDWESYLKAFHFSAEEEKLIAEKVFKSQIWNERDRGLFPEEEYRKRFIAELPAEYEADVKRVIEESGKTIGIKDYAETWTSYLKSQGYHLYILSNYSQFMLDQTRPGKMPFLKNMDGVIFSCEVQQIKPEADIYETLLSRFGLKPEESVFLDDRPENCEAARKLGIHAIEFHDLKQAAKELENTSITTIDSYIKALEMSNLIYLAKPKNEYEVLPGNIGLQDPGLVATIERYNEMLVERKRLLRTSTENNPTIINLDTSIRAMKSNVQATLDGSLKGLLITKADLEREASRFSRRISDAPGQERQFVSIARQQEIKAGLYLMLLQKREENAIALAATANNAKIIDEAIADDIPVSPKRRMIYLIALVLGIGIPVGIIYLIGLTKFKLEGRADVEKLTTIPIVGDIPLTDEKNEKDGSIAVFENQNNLMSETFRNIRTNLQFMLQNDKKVILVTSTVSGEGKSFISANLAISLSLLGKKVVIVGLDIRKPGLNKVFRLSTKEKGITLYLANPETDLMSLVQPSDINQNLYILPGGTVPPNPTELLARDGLDKAIEILKKNFDYVILDTAPVGMVTDTLLIGRVADLSVYVCRADYTHKVEYTLINELAEEKKLPNLCTVINGVDLKRRKYGYYYGYGKYGKYYGYDKRYGYGYGYGQEKGAKS